MAAGLPGRWHLHQERRRRREFELLVRQNNQDDQNAAQRYAADAKAVGIDMKISIVSEDQINERIYATSPTDENKYEPTYDAFYWGWGGDNDSPAFNFDVLVCGSSWQDSMYCNPAYDKLVADALKELDVDKRRRCWHDAERIALKDAPYLITDHDERRRRDLATTRGRATSRSRPAPARRSATRGCSCRLIKKAAGGGGSSNTGVIVAVVGGLVALVGDRCDRDAPAREGASRSSSSRSRHVVATRRRREPSSRSGRWCSSWSSTSSCSAPSVTRRRI